MQRSGANPQGRTAPSPRPDFARCQMPSALKPFWTPSIEMFGRTPTPAEWLYQLSIYALSGPSKVSVLLYPSVAATASDEVLEVRSPSASSDVKPAAIIIRPVPMLALAKLLDPKQALGSRLEQTTFARSPSASRLGRRRLLHGSARRWLRRERHASQMRYWWVNQNATYRHEVAGGFLWSPKRKRNGGRNPFYELMREVAPGDVVLSFADTRIAAIGIAQYSLL